VIDTAWGSGTLRFMVFSTDRPTGPGRLPSSSPNADAATPSRPASSTTDRRAAFLSAPTQRSSARGPVRCAISTWNVFENDPERRRAVVDGGESEDEDQELVGFRHLARWPSLRPWRPWSETSCRWVPRLERRGGRCGVRAGASATMASAEGCGRAPGILRAPARGVVRLDDDRTARLRRRRPSESLSRPTTVSFSGVTTLGAGRAGVWRPRGKGVHTWRFALTGVGPGPRRVRFAPSGRAERASFGLAALPPEVQALGSRGPAGLDATRGDPG